jgi:hypothetical protein
MEALEAQPFTVGLLVFVRTNRTRISPDFKSETALLTSGVVLQMRVHGVQQNVASASFGVLG